MTAFPGATTDRVMVLSPSTIAVKVTGGNIIVQIDDVIVLVEPTIPVQVVKIQNGETVTV